MVIRGSYHVPRTGFKGTRTCGISWHDMNTSGPEAGMRKRVSCKADGKLTPLVNLGVSWHEKLTLLVTDFSLPISAYPPQGH